MDFDFSHYYCYDELVAFLHQQVDRYPHLMQLEAIGKSYEGRSFYCVTLTNSATGAALDKPGYWIDGNTHAAEVTGSAVCLYTIAYLLDQYGQNARATRLLDHYTVYVLPRLAVDGTEQYLTTPDWLRSSPRLYPDAELSKGLTRADLNGDGLILQMRMRDECGAWKISKADARIMLRREPDEFDGTYYTLLLEGNIHDYNGFDLAIAPARSSIDFNRNYPNRWDSRSHQAGAGDYPLSEPETRAEVEFWHNHRNINGFYSYHTYGGVILRPQHTFASGQLPLVDRELFECISAKAQEITGYRCLSIADDAAEYPPDAQCGVMDDHAYEQYGWFGFTPELWDAPTAAGVARSYQANFYRHDPWLGEAESLKLMKWNDTVLAGAGFIDWQPFEHPQLGAIEIGGWDMKRVWTNAPAQYLPDLCERHCQFTIAHALMSPRLAIRQIVINHLEANVYHLTVELENQGFLPTHTSQKALERQAVRSIRVSLSLSETARLVMGDREQDIGHLDGRSRQMLGEFPVLRRSVAWVVQAESNSQIEIKAVAERAGTVKTTVQLQPQSA